MAHDLVLLVTVVNAMDAAAISHIVIDAHGQWAGALRNKPNIATQLAETAAAGFENVATVEVHFTCHTQSFHTIVETVERTEQCALATSRWANDACDLVAWDLYVDILENMHSVDVDIEMLGL